MILSLSQLFSRWTGSVSLPWKGLGGRAAIANQAVSPSLSQSTQGRRKARPLGPTVDFRWQQSLLLSTAFLLTLGVALLEISSAALFLGRMGLAALALVYGLTAVLGFGLRELSLVLSFHLPRRLGAGVTRRVTALAWIVLVGLWLGLCFGDRGGPLSAAGPVVSQLSEAVSEALLLQNGGAEQWGQTGLQVILLQCSATLLGQFHRAQVQGAQGQALQRLAGTGQRLAAASSQRPMALPWPSLATVPLAWFTFGAYALVGLVLPWCLGAAGPSLPLESIALGSGLLVLLGAIPRLILATPGVKVQVGRLAVDGRSQLEDPGVEPDDAPPVLLRRYGKLLLIFFALGQILTLLIQWGLWGQLQVSFLGDLSSPVPGAPSQAVEIAAFLAWIQGTVGFVGLLLQGTIARGWFSRHGAFTALAWSPLVMLMLSLLAVQDRLPLLLGLALVRGLDEGLQYSLGQYAQGRLLARLPQAAFARLRQQRIVTESLAMGLLGGALLLGWHILGEALPEFLLLGLAGLTLMILVVLACLRYRYFQLILGAIEQQTLHRRFPNGPLEQLGAEALLSQPESPLVKRGLVKSLKRSLGEPVQLDDALTTIRLLDRLDPALAVETLAPVLMRLPPMLQLEGLVMMTRLGRQSQGLRMGQETAPMLTLTDGGSLIKGQGKSQSLNRLPSHRYNPQRHLRNVEALMTPIAPPAIFAAALRHSLYLGPAIAPKVLQLHLQPERAPEVRAVAAAFALNPVFSSIFEDGLPFWGDRTPSHRLAQSQWSDLFPLAQKILRSMLTHEIEQERSAASEVLKDLADLEPFKAEIPTLLEDFSPQVRETVIAAIAQTRSQALYPHLLKALRSPLVEQPAHEALVTLGDDAVPLLQRCTQHPDLSLNTKERSWRILMEIATSSARTALAEDVLHQQGEARARLLTLLLSQSPEAMTRQTSYGMALSQALAGSEGVMLLVREELWLLSQLYAALVELHPKGLPGLAARQLRQAIQRQQRDVGERILLLLQIRYPSGRLERAVQQLRHRSTIPQGLKRLAQLLEPPLREPLLAVFDARPVRLKRAAFSDWEAADRSGSLQSDRCDAPERLRRLVALVEPGLDPEALACAYDLALEQEIALPDAALLRGINHRDLEVRAAAQAYLHRMPENVVTQLLESSLEG